MKKSALLLLVSFTMVTASMPAFAQAKPASGSSDNKIVGGFKKVGKGIMWGPRKMWDGMKSMGKKVTGKS